MALFKLLVGQHIQADPDAPALTPEQIKAGARRLSKTFKEGDTVESEIDMVAKHGAAKFVLVSGTPTKKADGSPAAPASAPLSPPKNAAEARKGFEAMSVPQLQAFASDHGIDLTGKKTKAEMVDHVMTALMD
jgi:hypothetical protein